MGIVSDEAGTPRWRAANLYLARAARGTRSLTVDTMREDGLSPSPLPQDVDLAHFVVQLQSLQT